MSYFHSDENYVISFWLKRLVLSVPANQIPYKVHHQLLLLQSKKKKKKNIYVMSSFIV